jgi:hypothetical protein
MCCQDDKRRIPYDTKYGWICIKQTQNDNLPQGTKYGCIYVTCCQEYKMKAARAKNVTVARVLCTLPRFTRQIEAWRTKRPSPTNLHLPLSVRRAAPTARVCKPGAAATTAPSTQHLAKPLNQPGRTSGLGPRSARLTHPRNDPATPKMAKSCPCQRKVAHSRQAKHLPCAAEEPGSQKVCAAELCAFDFAKRDSCPATFTKSTKGR